MKLHFGRRVFAPTWPGMLLTALVVPGLIGLGFWQLRRADEKRELMEQARQGRSVTRTLTGAVAGTLARYQHVMLSGHFDSSRQSLLDNMPSSQGQPGYRVLTPFQLTDRSMVLVDRGWLPLGVDRGHLPDIAVAAQPRTLTGLLDDLPRPGVRAGEAGIQPGRWPQVLNFPDTRDLQTLYGPQLQPRIVLLDADQPDGFERIRQIDLGFTPERHIGYAVQWFGMAATVAIIFLIVNLKRIES